MFRIAAFADMAGVSTKVLRDYDRRALFRPLWVDPATRYRMYSPAQLPELRRIIALRDLGVSLDDIARLVSDRADLRETLVRRRSELESARHALERRLTILGITISSADGSDASPDVVVRDLRPALVGTLDVSTVGDDVERAFYRLEVAVRDAAVRAPRPPGALIATRPAPGPRVEVFVPVHRRAPGFEARRLPAARVATVLHRGPYAGLVETRRALHGWITAAGWSRLDPERVIYLQFGAERELNLPSRYLAADDAAFVTELQVPVAARPASAG